MANQKEPQDRLIPTAITVWMTQEQRDWYKSIPDKQKAATMRKAIDFYRMNAAGETKPSTIDKVLQEFVNV